ncbi:MAG: hypothetical protein QTN59_13745 [Candidatus Electrothrix communis]|nr:hypothetical protein [Desulfobulbus sp. US4]WLE95736.1 MAG: hypothetical protein QTN59_13745 [Candidatus Electrothrix communis]
MNQLNKLKQCCWHIILLCIFISTMSGCGMLLDDGRMAAWENVRIKEEETKQKMLELREKELAGAFNAGDDVPMLTVTTLDSNGQPVEVSMNLLPVIKTLISAVSRDKTYGVELSEAKQPTGQAGESLLATTSLVKAVGSSPAALVLLTGEVMAKGIDAAGERMRADQINIDSNNSAPKTNTQTTNNTTNTTETTSDPDATSSDTDTSSTSDATDSST